MAHSYKNVSDVYCYALTTIDSIPMFTISQFAFIGTGCVPMNTSNKCLSLKLNTKIKYAPFLYENYFKNDHANETEVIFVTYL